LQDAVDDANPLARSTYQHHPIGVTSGISWLDGGGWRCSSRSGRVASWSARCPAMRSWWVTRPTPSPSSPAPSCSRPAGAGRGMLPGLRARRPARWLGVETAGRPGRGDAEL